MSRAKHTWIIIPTPEKASGKRLGVAGRSSEATVDPGEILFSARGQVVAASKWRETYRQLFQEADKDNNGSSVPFMIFMGIGIVTIVFGPEMSGAGTFFVVGAISSVKCDTVCLGPLGPLLLMAR